MNKGFVLDEGEFFKIPFDGPKPSEIKPVLLDEKRILAMLSRLLRPSKDGDRSDHDHNHRVPREGKRERTDVALRAFLKVALVGKVVELLELSAKPQERSYPAPHYGRPGQVGGSRPRLAGTPPLSDTLFNAIQCSLAEVARHNTKDHEAAIALRSDGSILERLVGKDIVMLSDEVKGGSAALVHNHYDTNSPFSPSDLFLLLENERLEAVAVVVKNGTSYIMRKTEHSLHGAGVDRKPLSVAYAKVADQETSWSDRYVRKMPDRIWTEIIDGMNRDVAAAYRLQYEKKTRSGRWRTVYSPGVRARGVIRGGPDSGYHAPHKGRPGQVGGSAPRDGDGGAGVRTGQPRHEFDLSQYWEDQSTITIFHGVDADRLGSIREKGIVVSTVGRTEGRAYFSTSPLQAWRYSAMGGEVAAKGYARLPWERRAVVVMQVPPKFFTATSHYLASRENFARVARAREEQEGFANYLLDVGGELYSTQTVPAEFIVDVFRYPKGVRGGPDSGYHAPHKGRPGQIGGSAPREGVTGDFTDDPRFREAAKQENISDQRVLDGGVTNTVLIQYEDDGEGVWKQIHDRGKTSHNGHSEVAAYRISEMLGLDVVPETLYAEWEGELGTSQRFIPDALTGEKFIWERVEGPKSGKGSAPRDHWAIVRRRRNAELVKLWEGPQRERMERIMVLDVITGNKDRHGGNWLVGDDGVVWAIDHGHAGWHYWGSERTVPHNPLWRSDMLPRAMQRRGEYQLSKGLVDKMRAITKVQWFAAFDDIHDPNSKWRVRPERGWRNLQYIVNGDGLLAWRGQ